MSERRPLTEGLKPAAPPVDPAVEKQFVFGGPPKAEPAASAPPGRVPLTIKIRGDFAAALKRASLERQLSGVAPNTMQEILDEALEPWLKRHGYLP